MRYVVASAALVVASLSAQTADLPAPPGKLVDIGGRRLHLLCTGQGSGPTVILEHGASAFAIDWTIVQRKVDQSARVCSYDRAGSGWSDPTPADRLPTETLDLHKLLGAAGEKPPYILVGASRGGLLVRNYALDYPDEVAGFVFVDSSSEDRLFTMYQGQGVLIAELTADQLRTNLPKQTVRIPRRNPQKGAPFDRLPPDLYELRIKMDQRLIDSVPETMTPEVIGGFQEQERALLARLLASRANGAHPFGDRPTIALTRGDERDKEREDVEEALAKLSTNYRFSVIPKSGHEIHLFEPDAVIQAITDVQQAIKTHAPLPAR